MLSLLLLLLCVCVGEKEQVTEKRENYLHFKTLQKVSPFITHLEKIPHNDCSLKQKMLFILLIMAPLLGGLNLRDKHAPECSEKSPCSVITMNCVKLEQDGPSRCVMLWKNGELCGGYSTPFVNICEQGHYCGYLGKWDEFFDRPKCIPNDHPIKKNYYTDMR